MESTLGLISKSWRHRLATSGTNSAWYPSSSPDLADPESIGARGGHGNHFSLVRRWGDKSPLLYREIPNASHGPRTEPVISTGRAFLWSHGLGATEISQSFFDSFFAFVV